MTIQSKKHIRYHKYNLYSEILTHNYQVLSKYKPFIKKTFALVDYNANMQILCAALIYFTKVMIGIKLNDVDKQTDWLDKNHVTPPLLRKLQRRAIGE